MAEKVSPMIINDPEDGREYTLEFSRRTVARTEQAGFNAQELESKSMTMIPLMFWGSFLMHHPYMTREQSDRILFDGLGGLTPKEMEYIGQLYAAPLKTLVVDEEEVAKNPRKMSVKF